MRTRKPWREKLDKPAELTDMPPSWVARYGVGKLLIPAPPDLEALIRHVKPGQVVTLGMLRATLANKAGAVATCPLTTGIFLRMIGEASEEDRAAGSEVTPYWRVVRDDGRLIDKLPGGVEAQADRLGAEGVVIVEKRGIKRAEIGVNTKDR